MKYSSVGSEMWVPFFFCQYFGAARRPVGSSVRSMSQSQDSIRITWPIHKNGTNINLSFLAFLCLVMICYQVAKNDATV